MAMAMAKSVVVVYPFVLFVSVLSATKTVHAFTPPTNPLSSSLSSPLRHSPTSSSSSTATSTSTTTTSSLFAAPKRLESNVDGVLYVNEKCINCSACAMFAPNIFEHNDKEMAHIVKHQPQTNEEIETARAALSACPVAAIRTETQAQRNHRNLQPLTTEEQELSKQLAISSKLNGRSIPFPRLISSTSQSNVYFMGHHNEQTFGATPYLFYSTTNDKWIMVDTPRYSKAAVDAVERITNGRSPDYLILTHVDDTAGHNHWKEHYPELKRIFHNGDLGRYNWIGDTSLENVEVLLKKQQQPKGDENKLQVFDLNGNVIDNDDDNMKNHEVLILHTPGHSPGSISILYRPQLNDANDDENDDDIQSKGVLFSGDTYAYRLSSNVMTGFPRYGNNRRQQADTLQQLVNDWGMEWDIVAPGHGHVRDYTTRALTKHERYEIQKDELQPALEELNSYAALRR